MKWRSYRFCAVLIAAANILSNAENSVFAQSQSSFYEIPALPLEEALIAFSKVARLSVDYSKVDLNGLKTSGTSGTLSKRQALRELLRGSGLEFEFIDNSTVRLFAPKLFKAPMEAWSGVSAEREIPVIEDLIVTAAKRPQRSFRSPVSITGVSKLALEDLGVTDMQSLAPHLAGVSTTNLGPGRNKIFIRGLSDGPFAERTQTMVGIYIDETPVNFSDTNPDISLFDVERVELVRGPQGTLYGAGSMGGLYRVITAKPVLDKTSARTRLSLTTTKDGGENGRLDFVLNKPLVTDKLGLRLAGYTKAEQGYIDNIALGLNNTNDLSVYGLRPALRWQVSDKWLLDFAANIQSIRYDDTQYYQENLGRNNRSAGLLEPYDDDFLQFNVTASGQVGKVHVTSASTYISRTIQETSDAAEGILSLGNVNEFQLTIPIEGNPSHFSEASTFLDQSQAGASAFFSRDDIETISHETRLRSEAGDRFEWLLGGFYLRRLQDADSVLAIANANSDAVIAFLEERKEVAVDVAVFGEATYHLYDNLSLTAGLRYTYNVQELTYSSVFAVNGAQQDLELHKETSRLVPKVAVRYEWSENLQTYAQVSTGYRVGGININTPLEAILAADPDIEIDDDDDDDDDDTLTDFQSDTLVNYELGLKSFWWDRKLSLNMSAFYVQWFDIQSDQIGANSLPFVVNVGDATNMGYELEFTAAPLPGLELRGSFFWNDSEMQTENTFLGIEEGNRLPAIAENMASFAILYQRPLDDNWIATFSADYAYIGSSSLTFDEKNSAKMGGYGILNARVQVTNDRWAVGLVGRNLTDTDANTFSFGNSFSLEQGAQITPPVPRTIGVFFEYSF